MERVAFIQADSEGQPYSVNGAAAARGFAHLGFTIRYFRPEERPDLPLGPDTVVVGGMGTVRSALEQIGCHAPDHVSVPAVLSPFLGRKCWRTTLGEVRQSKSFPLFLKPWNDAKVFTGQVIKDVAQLDLLSAPRAGFPSMDDDFALMAQEPLQFVSEWRFFVLRGAVAGVSFYQGDPLLFPAAAVVRLALGAYEGAPAGFSADFGVTSDGRTLLIEINDGYSLGHGGLLPSIYANLLLARWQELSAGAVEVAKRD